MKKLVLKKISKDSIATEHPELGGRFHIRPMDYDEALRYAEIVTKTDFERDARGNIVYRRNGDPAKKYAGDPREQIDFAASLVERVENIEFEGGAPFEETQDNMRWLLTLMATDDVEKEIPVDAEGNELDPQKLKAEELEARQAGTKKVMKPERENLYLWVLRKSAQYGGERHKVEQGN
jgi:hypothetical protein